MSSPDLELILPQGAHVADADDSFSQQCRDECTRLGLSRVRLLLLDADYARSGLWREEAQRWVDEQLRREGEWAFRGLVAGIMLLSAGIVVVAALLW
ncbi:MULTISPECIES: hypothetical protein [Xanthomonas]|uniref:hypothetical protein n=1 Tax=Xanthomonas TaxID=338 RepID=UPI000E32A6F4|nr:hypothetical protein [Xanthomonas campestris]MCC5091841.1 hypothetical protein [Xanthomonas campestris pv. incanae]MEA9609172.1 hypothetical protein [Xanthomonas campestris pv. incanae]MEA9619174.1 hypothetical protein [Xanthomonas campestris pv. incanae]RFF49014.1 hypothetical protein D0A38_00885 [Xanthomonas campestris pv. incanae]WDJ10537.1 hypothetical protein JH299_02875 [Xanthomonas campestris pv. incanae]